MDSKERRWMKFGFIGEEGEHVIIMSVLKTEIPNERKFEIVSMEGDDEEEEKFKISKYDDHYTLISNNDDEWMDGCINLLDHITDVFRSNIDTLYCINPYSMDFLEDKAPLRMTYSGGEDCNIYWDLVSYELNGAGKTGGLQLCTPLPEDYDFILTREYEYIRIERAQFARSDDVLKLAEKSKEVIFDESLLLSKGLNTIFNCWLQHLIDGLKFLSIRLRSYREFSAFNGIEHRITDTTEEVNYKSYTGELYRLSPGKRLRRDDGVIALFLYDPNTQMINFGVLTGLTVIS
uniref:FBA_2 domain-containing protein n=1 Tax=Caenorhabditis tropicalis TaxID=1561998 RepID=A0A1I7UZJ9_9PELO